MALRKRGISPDAIRKYWIDAGLKEVDIIFSWENLYAYNRSIVDPLARRYFFVWDPINVKVVSEKDLVAKIPLHPNVAMGDKVYNLGKNFNIFITKNDFSSIVDGKMFRLKDLGNFVYDGKVLNFINNDLSLIKKLNIIHWVPENSLPCKVIMPDGNTINGLVEPEIEKLENGIVQFERFGYVNIFKVPEIYGYFAHN